MFEHKNVLNLNDNLIQFLRVKIEFLYFVGFTDGVGLTRPPGNKSTLNHQVTCQQRIEKQVATFYPKKQNASSIEGTTSQLFTTLVRPEKKHKYHQSRMCGKGVGNELTFLKKTIYSLYCHFWTNFDRFSNPSHTILTHCTH